jgi:hypothetical protein
MGVVATRTRQVRSKRSARVTCLVNRNTKAVCSPQARLARLISGAISRGHRTNAGLIGHNGHPTAAYIVGGD